MFRQPLRNAKQRLRLFLSECGRRARVLRDSLRRQPNRCHEQTSSLADQISVELARCLRGLLVRAPDIFAPFDGFPVGVVINAEPRKDFRTAINAIEVSRLRL